MKVRCHRTILTASYIVSIASAKGVDRQEEQAASNDRQMASDPYLSFHYRDGMQGVGTRGSKACNIARGHSLGSAIHQVCLRNIRCLIGLGVLRSYNGSMRRPKSQYTHGDLVRLYDQLQAALQGEPYPRSLHSDATFSFEGLPDDTFGCRLFGRHSSLKSGWVISPTTASATLKVSGYCSRMPRFFGLRVSTTRLPRTRSGLSVLWIRLTSRMTSHGVLWSAATRRPGMLAIGILDGTSLLTHGQHRPNAISDNALPIGTQPTFPARLSHQLKSSASHQGRRHGSPVSRFTQHTVEHNQARHYQGSDQRTAR